MTSLCWFVLVFVLNVLSRHRKYNEYALESVGSEDKFEVPLGISQEDELKQVREMLAEIDARLRHMESEEDSEEVVGSYTEFMNEDVEPGLGAGETTSSAAPAASSATAAATTAAPVSPDGGGNVPGPGGKRSEGCHCAGRMNPLGEGGSHCRSLFEDKAWCYVEAGKCKDEQKSEWEGTMYSFEACVNPCHCSGKTMKKPDGKLKGGADCESHWGNGDTWCYADLGTCPDGAESKTMKGQQYSFEACPNPCECSGVQNTNDEGGSDCMSVWEGKQWCYVHEGVCPDSKLSKSMGHHWSNVACDHSPPAVLSPGELPEQCQIMACCGEEVFPVGRSRRALSSAEDSRFIWSGFDREARRRLADMGLPGPKLKNRFAVERPKADERRMPNIMHEVFLTKKDKIPVIFIHNENEMINARLRGMAKALVDLRVNLKAPPIWKKLTMQPGDVWVVGQGLSGFGLPCLSGVLWHQTKPTFHSVEPFMVRHMVRAAVPNEGITRIVFVGNNGNLAAREYSRMAQTTAIGFPTQMSVNRNALFAWLDHSDLREDITMKNYMKHMRREIAHTNGQEYTEIYVNGMLYQGSYHNEQAIKADQLAAELEAKEAAAKAKQKEEDNPKSPTFG